MKNGSLKNYRRVTDRSANGTMIWKIHPEAEPSSFQHIKGLFEKLPPERVAREVMWLLKSL